MDESNRLGQNIRRLRKFFGDTQKILGDAIFVKQNAISNYELGKELPSLEIMQKIANYYEVPIEVITGSNFNLREIIITRDLLFIPHNIKSVLPIFSSQQSFQNEYFVEAFKLHNSIYDNTLRVDDTWLDQIGLCIQKYYLAYQSNESKEDAAANLWGLLLHITSALKNGHSIITTSENEMSKRQKCISKAPEFKSLMDEIHSEDVSNFEWLNSIIHAITGVFYSEFFFEIKTCLKQTATHNALADYYIALEYCWGIVQNGHSNRFNRSMGEEMLLLLKLIKNQFAINYMKLFEASEKETR